MKTIKEAAAERVKYSSFPKDKEGFGIMISMAFCAGIWFAQRWISVEEELPEGVFHENTISRTVLVKGEFTSVHLAQYDHKEGRFLPDESRLNHLKFTHWRPIELK
jgi:hypothetical protein